MAIKFLKINSFTPEDTNALFEALCKKACDVDVDEAKIICNDSLDKKSVVGYKASLSDVIALIGMYDIEFELKTTFISRENTEKPKRAEVHKPNPPSDRHVKMKEQSNDISNPDLKIKEPDFLTNAKDKSPEQSVDPRQIPQFP